MLLASTDDDGRASWLGLTMLAFWTAWPRNAAKVAFPVASGRTRAWREKARLSAGRWSNLRSGVRKLVNWTSAIPLQASTNEGCTTYRTVDLSRLEVQEKEFRAFLNRLCLSRNQEEFDKVVVERGHGTTKRISSEQPGS